MARLLTLGPTKLILATIATAALVTSSASVTKVTAQSDTIGPQAQPGVFRTISWYGPITMTFGQMLQSNFSNFSPSATVGIEWAVADAHSGETLSSTFGKPTILGPMTGGSWTYQMRPDSAESRCVVVVWYRVTQSAMEKRLAVNLGSVEVFDNETMRTSTIVMANPSAPGDTFYATMR